MKNNFEGFALYENIKEDQFELNNMLEFIGQAIFDLQGFNVSRKVLIKRRFEKFMNSSVEETDDDDSGWGI